MSNRALENEIAGDPLARGYSGMTDEQLLASLNAEDVERNLIITSQELLAWSAGSTGAEDPRILKINDAESAGTGTAKALAHVAHLMITRDGTTLDLSRADRMAMVDELVATGVLSSGDKVSLVALGTESISRGLEIGYKAVVTVKDLRQHTITRSTAT